VVVGGSGMAAPAGGEPIDRPADLPGQPTNPSSALWVLQHRRLTVGAAIVVTLALIAFVDWPHRATTGQLRSDFALFSTQVRGDIQSCSVEVEQTLSAYNQITAGVETDRATATAIAAQTALDCTPMGNSRIDDLGTIQPPRSLDRFDLDAATQRLYAWSFPAGVDVAQDVERLLAKPGDPTALADVRNRLSQMSADAAVAQHAFDQAAAALGLPPVTFGLDEVRPGVLVG
jgi:hypothetical protein